jgi:hypothetical protein
MPAINPRIQVTLSPATYKAVVAVADAKGIPKARVITEFLEEAVPMLHATAEALRVVETAPKKAAAILARASGDAIAAVLQAGLDLRPKRGRPPKRG